MVLCKTHGGRPAMHVSRDVVDEAGQVSPHTQLVRVDFEYEGTPTHWFYLSSEIASRLGFTRSTVLPLPDHFPPWVDEVLWLAVCTECFDQSRHSGRP